ncbi:putative methyltransferase-domain-containing protein [Flagelloscypha sp. PMI_526]|nr:putative methyltransferase-domain-containing protein [Flagelloscypha sp. PMI_526]
MKQPSEFLPPIRSIRQLDPAELLVYISYLRTLYNPEVRGSRIAQKPATNIGHGHSAFRTNNFERTYALQWATSLISKVDSEGVVDAASSFLALCSGSAGAGQISRTFVYDVVHKETLTALQVRINDTALDNQDFHSMGAQTWGGACVLTELICTNPSSFGLSNPRINRKSHRILELGAGTGLVSLAVHKLCYTLGVRASIIATDFYPSVLGNLASNISLNLCSERDPVQSSFLDWSDPEKSSLAHEEPFDLLFGADIVYEPEHAGWIRNTVARYLMMERFTSKETSPAFHLLMPLRPTHTTENATVESLFHKIERNSLFLGKLELCIVEKNVIACEAEGGEPINYIHYIIGWC